MVIDKSLAPDDRETALVVPVCADSLYRAKLKVNDTTLDLPIAYDTSRWDRCVVTLPKRTNRLTVYLEGRPGTTVALGDIQFFQ